MFKKISMNKWGIIIAIAGIIACVMTPGCFNTPSVSPPVKAAAESTAKAMPAAASGGASIGTFLADIGGATAVAAVADGVRPFFLTGLGLVVLGAVTFVFGGRATGGCLVVLGALTSGLGVLFIQYPWIVLLFALIIGALLAWMTYTRYKARQQLVGTEAEAAQKTEEVNALNKGLGFLTQAIEAASGGETVKAVLREGGAEVVQALKKIVSPIKAAQAVAASSTAETVRV